MSKIVIRQMRADDVNSVVSVHMEVFTGFFLSFLGRPFLRQLYHGILDDPSGIGYVYERDRRLLGFVAGTSEPAGLYGRLLRQRWWRFGLASVGAVLRRPRVVPRLLRAIRMPQEAGSEMDYGSLMSLAVLREAQGKGIGRVLVAAFLQEARHRGVKVVTLTTDHVDNDAVNSFYQRFGFRCARTFVTREGRSMNEYEIELNHMSPSGAGSARQLKTGGCL
ncbi:MAG: GNAT family N-acetyltransferase [Acidobacteria bacterium]|nr:GNAT family N-acetyltransferase [Acidobacteriota bacterium]